MVLDDLVSTALLGTRGAAIRLPPLAEELSAVLPPAGDSESQLLDAAAAVTIFTRAGALPRDGVELPQPSAPDRWAECTPRAADLLAQAFEERLQPLLVEWLELASAARLRPPHRLLPPLLEKGAGRRAIQAAVSAVIDERGRWLMQFNPRWQFANRSEESPDEAWQVGNRQQRAEALRSVRATDAAKARDLIATTWKDDAAEERADWVECLRVGLSDEDEPFLETCLDDRSSRVREAAAELLSRLPGSRLVQRMIARVTTLFAFTPATEGKLLKLKRGTKATLEVTLPEAFDKAMQRDGMTEKPSEKIGQKQWWLLQMLSCVPLDYWTRTFGAQPAEIVEAAPEEFQKVLVRGWLAALSRGPVVEWIEPLVSAAGSEILLEPTVLEAIPAAKRAEVLGAILRGAGAKGINLHQIFEAWRPLDEDVSGLLLNGFELPMLIGYDAAFYLHPEILVALEARLTTWAETAEHPRRIDQALSIISLRRELHKEFAR